MFLESYKKALEVIMKKPFVLWGLSLLSVVIMFLGSIITAPIFVLGVVVSFLITCGMSKVYLDGLEGKEVNSEQLFACFNKNFLKVAGGMAWMNLWIFIWALIPIAGPIIAIVKAYSYRFVPYILITKPEVSATEALRLSMKMTNGIKGQMFLADLCFVGGVWVASFVLGLFSAIPVLGTLFALALAVLLIAVGVFGNIFTGLYQAYFFAKKDAE